MPGPLLWLITGTSSGTGHELAKAAVARGDLVIATARARHFSALAPLEAAGAKTLELDVTWPPEKLKQVAERAVAIYGRAPDVIVNNAGCMQLGPLEACASKEDLDQFGVNVFGPLNVSRAFLPYLRQRRSGTLVFIGSLSGWHAMPHVGLNVIGNHAIRAIAQSFNMELQSIDPALRALVFELGYMRTNFFAEDHVMYYDGPPIHDYSAISNLIENNMRRLQGHQPGSPAKAASLIVDLVRGEGIAEGRTIPTVLQIGSDAIQSAKEASETTLKLIEEWGPLLKASDYKP